MTYSIDDQHGNLITTGIQSATEARKTLVIRIDLATDLRVACIPGCDPDAEGESFRAAYLAALERAADGRAYRTLESHQHGYLEHSTTEEEQELWQDAHDRCSRSDDGTWS